jgi:hypothetical protein
MEDFKEGDIYYTFSKDDGKYYVSKILKIDDDSGSGFRIYHVMPYSSINQIPTIDNLHELKIFMMHAPMNLSSKIEPSLSICL